MADFISEEKRSKIMSSIRGKWTNPEKRVHNMLKGRKIHHQMHPKIFGNPDIYLKGSNTVIFIDGCFWHGCPKHGHMPKSKRKFWKSKIEKNMARDKKYTKELAKMGFNVIRVWECELEKNCRKLPCLNVRKDLNSPRQLCNMSLTVAEVRRTISNVPAAERVMPTLVFSKKVFTWENILDFLSKSPPSGQRKMLNKIEKIRGNYGKVHYGLTAEEKIILKERYKMMFDGMRFMTFGRCLTKKDIIEEIEKGTELGIILAHDELKYLNKLWMK